MSSTNGLLCLVLHAHLPYIRHAEHEHFLEEDWLFEAIVETYVPLLRMLERLDANGIQYRLSMSLTPSLAAMLGDDLLQRRFRRYLTRLIRLIDREVEGHSTDSPIGKVTHFYRRRLHETREFVDDRWGGKLLHAFADARARGGLEILTCTATHGLLPAMSTREAQRAQVRAGVESYRRLFGEGPRGIWLAECGYEEGVDEILAESGIEYFYADSHAVLLGDPRPALGVNAPVRTPAGVFCFPRDDESSKQVWSADEGYPGDPCYREFYRDLGYDADYDYIRPYLHPDGVRRGVGLKYYRITGNVALHEKDYYDADAAAQRAEVHAGNFAFNREVQARSLAGGMDRPPLIVSPYDAELFGHWWFEGPLFLEHVLRKVATEMPTVELITGGDYIDRGYPVQEQQPNASTWGDEGYFRVWLNGSNAWFYRHQHHAERRMSELARRHPHAEGILKEALDQAARELLLAQSSDWAFIVTMGTTVPYAVRRFKSHVDSFASLADSIEQGAPDSALVHRLRGEDPIFPWLDYRVFA
jgi:1,4-alpha-glucan branching enzyme